MNTNKILLTLALAAVFFLQSCDIDFLDCYDGKFIEKELVLDEINAIEIDFPCEIVLVDGPTQQILVNGKEDLISDLEDKSNVSGKTWKVRLKNNCIKHREDITFTIAAPGLKKVDVDGSVRLSGDGVLTRLAKIFEIKLDGDADVSLDLPELDKLLVDADGDIDLRFTGSADAAVYTLDGSGKVRGLDFQTASTFLNMDGNTNAEIWATEKLDVKLDGKATVCVKGHPALVSQVNGSGKILDCN